jgi:tryptophan-rich sensory protein
MFLALVVGGGLALGFLTTPGDWYASLAKPTFNPPGWLFGTVWTALYILIAIAGWRIWQRDRHDPRPYRHDVAQAPCGSSLCDDAQRRDLRAEVE